MADNIVSDTPEWHNADADTQQAIANLSFNKMYGKDKAYINSSDADKALTREAFNNILANTAYKSDYNKTNIAATDKQAASDQNGYLANLVTKVIDSHRDLLNRVPIMGDSLNANGQLSSSFPERGSKYFEKQKERIYTEEDKAVAKTLLDVEKKIEKNGFWSWDGVKAMVAAVPELVANPGGVINVGADSISSMTAIAGGAAIGGAAGSYVPGIGTAVGAGIGMFTAEMTDAASSKLLELAKAKLDSVGLPPTKQNLEMLSKNTEWVKSAQTDALKYSATLAGTDTLIGAGLGRVFSAPARAALNKARIIAAAADQPAMAALAKAAGITAEKATENLINREAAAIMKAASFKSKIGMFAGRATGEAIGEPVTEAAAKSAIGEKLNFTDLAQEFLGGVGSGPIAAVIDKAAFGTKIAADTTKNFVGNILSATPESKAMVQTQKAALKTVQTQGVTQADANYKKDIASIDHNDAVHAELSNPAHAKYNPIKAVEILTKYDTPDAYNKANAIEAYERQAYNTDMARMQDIVSREEAGETISEAEKKEFIGLDNVTTARAANLKKLDGFVTTIYNNAQAARDAKRDAAPVVTPQSNQQEVVESVSFGSSPHKNALTDETTTELLKRTDLTPDVKELLKNTQEAKALRTIIEESVTKARTNGKSIADVSNDIYHGKVGSDFKGIDSYVQGITHFLNPLVNNAAKATAELTGLKKFRDAMQIKSSVATDVFEAMTKDAAYVATPEQQAVLKKHGLTIHPIKSRNLIANMQQETAALNSEVTSAESLYKVLSNKSNTTTSTPVQTAPTAPVVKPVVAPVVVNTPVVPKPTSVNTAPSVTHQKLSVLIDEYRTNNTTPEGLAAIQGILVEAKANPKSVPSAIARLEAHKDKYEAVYKASKSAPTIALTSESKPESIEAINSLKEPRNKDNPFEQSVVQGIVYHATKNPAALENIVSIRDNEDAKDGIWFKGKANGKILGVDSQKIGFYTTRNIAYGATVAGADVYSKELTAEQYETDVVDKNGVVVVPLYVNITNPYLVTGSDSISTTSISLEEMNNLIAQGYDGILDADSEYRYEDILIFSSDQIARVKPEFIEASAPAEIVAPPERKERKPRKRVPPMRNLFTDIRKLGGVTREALMYEIDENVVMGRSPKGKRINLYRRITNKESTFSLDQIAEAMRSEGWQIPVDDYGKAELQPFLDMIQDHKNGDRPIHPDDVDRVQRIRERKEDLRRKQEGFEAFESKEVTQEQMDQWDDEADHNMEAGHGVEEINRILEEYAQENAEREAQGVFGNDGGKSSVGIGETRGEITEEEHEELVAERAQIAGLANMLGVNITADPDYISNIDEILETQSTLIDMVAAGTITRAALEEALSWLHTAGVKLDPQREGRATFKKVDGKGNPLSAEDQKKNKDKFERRHKGNKNAYIVRQIIEELGEFLEQHMFAQDIASDRLLALIEAQKRVLKSERFEPENTINDKNSPYDTLTNAQALDKALAAVGLTNNKSVDELAADLNIMIQQELKSPEPVTESPVIEDVPDNLEAFDGMDAIEIQVGTDAKGNPIMMSYHEALADINSQIDEAKAILKCVKG